jgi:hypothetical protein
MLQTFRLVGIVLILSAAFGCTAPSGAAAGDEAVLIGAWIHVSGPAYFEEMAFNVEDGERVFASWLHRRPFITGHWSLSGNTLKVEYHGKIQKVWTVVQADRSRLLLREDGLQEITVYKKARKK